MIFPVVNGQLNTVMTRTVSTKDKTHTNPMVRKIFSKLSIRVPPLLYFSYCCKPLSKL